MVRTTALRTTTALVAAVAVFVYSGMEVAAQSSTTRGFQFGAHIVGASLTPENSSRSNAGGGGIRFGYGINRSLTLFFQADGAAFDVETQLDDLVGTWTMAHADLGARYNFANSLRRWVPYLQAAFTARAVTLTDIPAGNTFAGNDVSFNGGAFTVGGGVMFYTSQGFAIDAGLLLSGGNFTSFTVGNTTLSDRDAKAQSSRFNVGISWWP